MAMTCLEHTAAYIWLSSAPQVAVRALMRNQQGDSSGEPVLPPGNSITHKHKVDTDRHRVNAGDSSGTSDTSSTLHAIRQVPELQPLQQSPPLALCRALYDFNPEEINLVDSKCCLSFLKVWLSNSHLNWAGKASATSTCTPDLLKDCSV